MQLQHLYFLETDFDTGLTRDADLISAPNSRAVPEVMLAGLDLTHWNGLEHVWTKSGFGRRGLQLVFLSCFMSFVRIVE